MSNDNRAPGLKIKHVRFATTQGQGIIVGSPREAEEHMPARATDKVDGYDIWYMERRQAFRFDRYKDGKYDCTKWMHVSQIRTWEEWDAPADLQSKSAA